MDLLRMSDDNQIQKDCLECRIVSGFGVIAIGFYIFTQAQKRKKFEANIMKLISGGAVSLGIARLLNIPIFKGKVKNDKS